MEDRGWKVEGGRWKMEDGRRRQGDKEARRQGNSPLLPFSPSLSPLVSSVLLFLAILCLFFLSTAGTLGNGVPVKVFLNYLPDVSNWGPEMASGEAVLAVGEGWATVSVQGLPRLQDEVYVAWVIPQQGAAIPIGKFNTDDAGTGDFEIRGLSVPHEPYRLFLLTVEQDSDQYQTPGNRRSIAGRFPSPELRATPPPVSTPLPVPTPTPEPGEPPGRGPGTGSPGSDAGTASSLARPVPLPPAPRMLPVTGGIVGPIRRVVSSTAWGVVVLAGLALIGLAWFANLRQGGQS